MCIHTSISFSNQENLHIALTTAKHGKNKLSFIVNHRIAKISKSVIVQKKETIFMSLTHSLGITNHNPQKDSIQQIHHIFDELSIIRIRLGQSIIGFQIQEFFFILFF